MFQIKQLIHIEDMRIVQMVEQQVWNYDVTPIHQTYTAANNGGLVLGAYEGDQLVGFQYSFPGYKNGRSYLCSHMLGILPNYRNSGLGEQLKHYQRQLAIDMGYSWIVWTYDPLESVNAYLNLHKLKGIGAHYYANYYGDMLDALNKGMPTDRFLVEWWIHSEHVMNKISTTHDEHYSPILEIALDPDGLPYIIAEREPDLNQAQVQLPIPENIQLIKKQKPELALEWRIKTRRWFQALCMNGFVAEDIVRNRQQKTASYIFKKRDQLLLTN